MIKYCCRGISALISIVIIVSVGIAISIAFTLWSVGIIGSTGYGTKPIMIGVSEFRAIGPLSMILIQNLGGEIIYVDDVRVGKWRVDVITAYSFSNLEPRLKKVDGEYLVTINPGEMVEIWTLMPEGVELKPGVEYRISVHTTLGFSAEKIIRAERWMLIPPTVDLYIRNRDLTYHINFARLNWCVHEGSPENPGDVLWSGSLIFLEDDYVSIRDNPNLKSQPVITVLNPMAGRADFIVWVDHNLVNYEYGSGYYKLDRIENAVPFLDFILFFEDLWSGPGNAGDADYNEHVTRVTWMRNGKVRVAVYFGAHAYTFDVYVGGEFVYTIRGTYHNIIDFHFNGKYGVDDLRASISDKTWIVSP